MAAHPRPFHNASGAGDTTHTKIFVGGLAWETQRHTMRRYFEQFGEIVEAVVITDKNTGRSKGFGFVTFKDPDSATRAWANCNLAYLGAAHRSRPPTPQHAILMGPFRPSVMSSSAYRGPSAASASTAYYHQPADHAWPYSVYGYSAGYSQESMYPIQQQQQQHLSRYHPAAAAAAAHGVFPNYYPYYAHGGFGLHYPQMLHHPYLPQQFGSGSAPILSWPAPVAAPNADY